MQWSLILLFLMAQCCFMDCQLYQFHYINENKTWTEAQQYCREKHTDLVTVTNMKDMKRLINISAGEMKEAWIGLYDQTHGNRTWYWSLPGVEFNESESNWYPGEPTDRKKSWQEAQSYCREKHTDLISGTKQLQDEEVKNLKITAYFGLFRDTWRWSDGSNSSFRHWNNELSNVKYNSGQCAMTVFDDETRWKNENCDERKPFICYDDNIILIKENKTWEDALSYCRHHYHDLVTITNLDKLRLIEEKAKKASTLFIWMGLRYNRLTDMWFWICKEMISYKSRTSEGQMNDCGMSGAMEAKGQHRWFQRNDTEELNFICFKNGTW
ncbi:C-type mannose receptor 2-like [Poecilia latipinna]|uniref:C-type mannose receptor 2-like n=1 Tax=Poecilia latipinna TaxID=48699 RepID=UPI00072E1103|nr:PREDICTED: C-type mannose receptor 2-like [Poecilia latipinna]